MRISLLAIVLCALIVTSADAHEKHLVFGAGAIHILDSNSGNVIALSLENHQLDEFWSIRPSLLLMIEVDGSAYAGAGVRKDFKLGGQDSWGVSLLAGYYNQGNSEVDLGSEVQFYSSINYDYYLPGKTQLRLQLAHLSNSSISSVNPGTEILSVNWVVPY
ncbi:MAG: acyloxyacyl hydrolase [Gammaproteobacteria bacterium]|nr:acyloxyacyl hydrolase [Gammaproteobacteria bacterium]